MGKLAKALSAAAGNAGESKLYVEDVFSIYLYEGSSNPTTINNGIDFAGEGGLFWVENFTAGQSSALLDTERGTAQTLATQDASGNAAIYSSKNITYNNNGVTIPGDSSTPTGVLNFSNYSQCSLSFRKAEKFFDVVTYSGSNSAQAISHALDSVPGMIFVKRTDTGSSNWIVYHQGLNNGTNPEQYWLELNQTSASGNGWIWNQVAPTSTTFTVGGGTGNVNTAGGSYVAYVFASDAGGFGDDGTESIVKCGRYTQTGSPYTTVNLGWEPQYIFRKRANGTNQNWYVFDTMRGLNVTLSKYFNPNNTDAESSGWADTIYPTATGFFTAVGNPGDEIIYMAIRRGPMKTPSAGTEVFTMDTMGSTGDGKTPGARSPWAADFAWWREMDGASTTQPNTMATRLNVPKTVQSQFEYVEGTNNALGLNYSNGFTGYTSTSAQQYAWMFRRGTAFCDVVSYKGYGGNGLFYHNLTVIPEMVWIKSLNVAGGWQCGVSFGATQYIYLPLNDDNAWGLVNYNAGSGDYSGAPTATRVNTSGSINDSGTQYVAYLWATLAGVSKVGSYTGTGSDINVDCGFSAGARFILIRRTDSDGNWVYYDYLRGITVNNDPGINLNDIATPVVANYVKPLNAGFIVTSSASADLNANGGKYTFLAIS